jgi:hypothetical protein
VTRRVYHTSNLAAKDGKTPPNDSRAKNHIPRKKYKDDCILSFVLPRKKQQITKS